jgi:uncharacterized membrane protein
MHKNIISIFTGLAFLGLIDTLYLSYNRLTRNELVCNILDGCDVVTSSKYADLFGIPLAYLGLIFYVLILLLILFRSKLQNSNKWPVKKSLEISISIGFLMSLYFFYIQFAILKTFCEYCLVSLGINLVMFILVIISYLTQKNRENILL